MSISDPVQLVCQPGHDKPYYLKQGREWFYDEQGCQIRFGTMEEAVAWCKQRLGVSPFDCLPEPFRSKANQEQERWEREGQPRLL